MANPFRFLLIANNRALLITLTEGGLESILRVDLEFSDVDHKAPTTKDLWLRCCHSHPFVHLAVRLTGDNLSGAGLSLLEQVDYYPRNDFVRYIMRKGILQVFFNLMFPFLSA
jgi:hypothetical protein